MEELFLDGHPLTNMSEGRAVTAATSVTGIVPAVSGGSVSIPGRHGVIPSLRGTFGKSTYKIALHVWGRDNAEARLKLADLNRRFSIRHRLFTLRREQLGMIPVEARGEVVASIQPESNEIEARSFDVTYVIEIPSGIWQDAEESRVLLKAGSQVIDSMLGGSAPTEPMLEVVGNGSNTYVQVTDNISSAWVRFSGNVSAGRIVKVYPNQVRAIADNGVAYSGLIDLSPVPFYLSPEADVTVVKNGQQSNYLVGKRGWFE